MEGHWELRVLVTFSLQHCPTLAPGSHGCAPAVPSAVAAQGQASADRHGAAGTSLHGGFPVPSRRALILGHLGISNQSRGQDACTSDPLWRFRDKERQNQAGEAVFVKALQVPHGREGEPSLMYYLVGDLCTCLSPQQLEVSPALVPGARVPVRAGIQVCLCGGSRQVSVPASD